MSGLARHGALVLLSLVLAACAPKKPPHGPVDPTVYEAELPPVEAPRPPEPRRSTMEGWDPQLRDVVARAEAKAEIDLHVMGQPGERIPPVGHRVELGAPDPALVVRFAPLIARQLSLYPVEVRQRFVPHVVLVGKLRWNGTPFLGMAHPREGRFDLALRRGTRAPQLLGTLHHEIGHLFMADARFPRAQFKAISDGRYVGLRPNDHWNARDPQAWLRAGFVSRYGSKNPHEDFAEIVQLGFINPEQLQAWTQTYPKIRQKLDLITRHYDVVAPGMLVPWTGAGFEAWKRWAESRR